MRYRTTARHPETRAPRCVRTSSVKLAIVAALLIPAFFSATADETRRVAVRVPGTLAWVDTGLTVGHDDRITITGSGEVCFNEHSESCFPPQGYPRDAFVKDYFELDYSYCEDAHESFDHAALIARIGETVLQVGRRITLSGVSGRVELGVNDCSLEGEYGNSGAYRAVIVVEGGE